MLFLYSEEFLTFNTNHVFVMKLKGAEVLVHVQNKTV